MSGVRSPGCRQRARGLLALVGVVCLVWACGCGGDERHAASPSASAAAASGAGLKGVPVGADTLANTRIGGPYGTVLAFRFRSGWTGSVRGVRVYVVLNADGRQGYSGGTGGRLRVTLVRDSGPPRHVPTRDALASATLTPPRRDGWPLVRFGPAAHVVAGHDYHVVFTNVDPSPRINYVSINALLSYGHGEARPRVPGDLSVLLGTTSDGGRTPRAWQPRREHPGERYAPILDVSGGRPSEHLGLSYMEVWSANPKPIGGAAKVRELLGRGTTRAITGAWLRVRRRPGATAPLELAIGPPAGAPLAAASVPARAVGGGGPRWVHVRFRRPVPPPPGQSLALTASSRAPSSYEAFPLRKGTEFGFDPRTAFGGGYAQFTDGGAWVGWDQWGTPDRHDGDLQFALDTARGAA